ncbi:MAG: signal peptide peptidase SppA [Bergeyella sp.]
MKNFFNTVLANIVAIFLVLFLFFMMTAVMLVLSSLGENSAVKVKKNSVLTLDFRTNIIDSPAEDQEDFFAFNKKTKNLLVYDVLQAIKKAKTDDNIKGISIESDHIGAGLTQLDDIRNALEDFKKSGKFVYAYGNTVSQGSYYLGSAADQYYLHPAGGIDLKGMAAEVTFFKDFTDKYGIGVDVIRHGKYKAAVEPFLRNDISEENKEQLSVLLNDIWSNTSRKISISRKIDSAQFKTVVDSLYGFIPEMSIAHKLADKLIQKSEYDNILKNKLKLSEKDKLNKISFSKYVKSMDDARSRGEQVAVLYASGSINDGEGYDNIYSRDFVKYIKDLADDDKVKAVVFRINSPGGSANASDEILFELSELKKKKPLIVSFGDYAASGGYYIAMAGDKIFSEPNTLTGSIGVFGVIPNYKELANRNGIRTDVVETNVNSSMYSPMRGLNPNAMDMMSKNIEATYKRFVHHITKNRKKAFEQIDEVGGGRIWSGTRAKQLGLVDELGTLQDAIDYAAKQAKLSSYNVSSYPKTKTQFEILFEDMNEDDISAKILKNKLGEDKFKTFEMLTNPKADRSVMMELPYRLSF